MSSGRSSKPAWDYYAMKPPAPPALPDVPPDQAAAAHLSGLALWQSESDSYFREERIARARGPGDVLGADAPAPGQPGGAGKRVDTCERMSATSLTPVRRSPPAAVRATPRRA